MDICDIVFLCLREDLSVLFLFLFYSFFKYCFVSIWMELKIDRNYS